MEQLEIIKRFAKLEKDAKSMYSTESLEKRLKMFIQNKIDMTSTNDVRKLLNCIDARIEFAAIKFDTDIIDVYKSIRSYIDCNLVRN